MEVGVVILFLAGTGTIVGCVFWLRYENKVQKTWKLVSGTVLSCFLSSYNHNHAGFIYTKRVEYEIDGKRYEWEINGSNKIKKGKKITLRCNPADPYKIEHYHPIKTYVGITITAVIGIGCFIGAISLIIALINH